MLVLKQLKNCIVLGIILYANTLNDQFVEFSKIYHQFNLQLTKKIRDYKI